MSYTSVALGDVLTLALDQVEVDPSTTYRMAGMYGFGRGLFAREPIRGSQTSYKKLTRLRAGQLVYGRLNAWEGGIAVVPPEFDGYFMSAEFPTFNPNENRISSSYLDKVCRWPTLWADLFDQSRGMGSNVGARRLRLHPEQLLQTRIPLPDVREQTRIANRLDSVFVAIHKTDAGMAAAIGLADTIVDAYLARHFDTHSDYSILGDLADITRGKGSKYMPGSGIYAINQACVRWEGIDLSQAREVDSIWEESVPSSRRAQFNDLLVNSTGEGTVGRAVVVEDQGVGLSFDSHVMAVRTDTQRLRPDYLSMFFRSPQGQLAIEEAKGANTTKQTELGKRRLEMLEVPIPPSELQDRTIGRYRALLGKVTDLRALMTARASTMEALPISVLNQALDGH